MRLLKLVPDDTNLDFMRWRNLALVLSIIVTVASLSIVAMRGLNLGVDFVGGQMVRATFAQPIDVEQLRSQVNRLELGHRPSPSAVRRHCTTARPGRRGPAYRFRRAIAKVTGRTPSTWGTCAPIPGSLRTEGPAPRQAAPAPRCLPRSGQTSWRSHPSGTGAPASPYAAGHRPAGK